MVLAAVVDARALERSSRSLASGVVTRLVVDFVVATGLVVVVVVVVVVDGGGGGTNSVVGGSGIVIGGVAVVVVVVVGEGDVTGGLGVVYRGHGGIRLAQAP